MLCLYTAVLPITVFETSPEHDETYVLAQACAYPSDQ